MILLVWLLLQQAPTLTAGGSLELEDLDRQGLVVSSTGKYVVVVESSRLRVLEAETLKPVTDLSLRWTALRFDERDETLLVVGDEATRVATSDWTVRTRAAIPHAQFAEIPVRVGKDVLQPGQALILPELDFYYCTKDGSLSIGSLEGGKVDEKPMNFKRDLNVSRVFGQFQGVLALAAERSRTAAIADQGTVYQLVGCRSPHFASDVGNVAVFIGEEDEALYAPRTWKVLTVRRVEGTTCAAYDRASGWVFTGDGQGLRGWHKDRFAWPVRFDAVQRGLVQLSVDGPRRVLFTLERRTLRRWKIEG